MTNRQWLLCFVLLAAACSASPQRAALVPNPSAPQLSAPRSSPTQSTTALAAQPEDEPNTSIDPAETIGMIDEMRAEFTARAASRDAGADPDPANVLTPNGIRQVILRNLGHVAACHEAALERDPNVHGRIVTRYLVGPDGAVRAAGILETGGIHDGRLLHCLVNVVRRMRFAPPAGHGVIVVDYPFTLEALRDEPSTSSSAGR